MKSLSKKKKIIILSAMVALLLVTGYVNVALNSSLSTKVTETNAEKNLCNRVPSLPELEKMIAQAKELEPVITY